VGYFMGYYTIWLATVKRNFCPVLGMGEERSCAGEVDSRQLKVDSFGKRLISPQRAQRTRRRRPESLGGAVEGCEDVLTFKKWIILENLVERGSGPAALKSSGTRHREGPAFRFGRRIFANQAEAASAARFAPATSTSLPDFTS